jgi:rod shape-determining protein MreC
MESFFSRYRNLVVLLAALLLQVIGLAVQVRKTGLTAGAGSAHEAGAHEPGSQDQSFAHDQRDGRSVRLIRLWAAGMVTPFERAIHGSGQGLNGLWSNYVDLRHTRDQNKELQQTVDRLRLEQATLLEDARQGQRLQGLLKFQENYIYKTTAAQVIGSSGSIQSRVIWLDKGSEDGLGPDMAVITGDGIVGKVREVFSHSAQVLVINDQTSGAGVVLETTRIRGILRGNAFGQPQVINILADQRIQPGEHVLTAGGDQIFPRGLPVGVVEKVVRDQERGSFINVIVKPAANLQHLDEVLVITSLDAHLSAQQRADLTTSEELKGAEVAADAERKKAAAEMAERLPGLKDPNAPDDGKPEHAKPATPPDGGPPLPPIAPRPLPAKHPDRFSPGGAGESSAGAVDSGAGAGTADANGDGSEPVRQVPRAHSESQTAKPQSTRPESAKPGTSKPLHPPGRVQ